MYICNIFHTNYKSKKSWRSAKVVCEDSAPYHSAVIAEISMRYSEA